MRVAVHFPVGHPLAADGGVVAYKLGRIRDGIDNHVIHTGEIVPLDEFTAGLVAQAKAEYPDAEVKVERLVSSEDGQTASWVAAEDFDPDVHAPAAAGENVERTIDVAAEAEDSLMAFAAATVLTNLERAMVADRLRTTPATYTTAPKFLAIGTGATAAARTAAAADTALSTEVETRTSGTESIITTTLTGDTLQVSGTITMTAARAVDEGGLFDAVTVGHMAVSWTQAVDNFAAGDTYTITVKIQWL